MKEALVEASNGEREGNVPVGAVVVRDGLIIGRGHNRKDLDPTEHAEIVAIRDACRHQGHWNLRGCILYVTVEPCPMCAGAIVQARLARVVFGVRDPRAGACGTLYSIPDDRRLNHRSVLEGGILAPECAKILQDHFQRRRQDIKKRRDGRVVEGGRLEID
ncbi:MAG: nucleoside deaminase [Synergistales bacterium]|nr:nucleoside deaminase [Synergistales bacterium]